MIRHSLRLLVVLLALFAVAGSSLAQESERIVTGKLLLSANKLRPGDSFELAFKGKVTAGYHIGAAHKDSLYPAKLKIDAPKALILDPVHYPLPKRISSPLAPGQELPVYEDTFVIKVKGRVRQGAKTGAITIKSRFDSQGCKEDQCFPPETVNSKLTVKIAPKGTPVKKINGSVFGHQKAETAATSKDHNFAADLEKRGLPLRLLTLFGLGLLLAFTPCVYPMIPVTVGYFSGQHESSTRRVMPLAAAYVLGIALTYSTLGAVAATTGGVFGAAMQSPVVLLGIALVLLALAMSMFGLYELRPPAFIESKASARSGILGALFMGLIFGIVAAPCVGPVVLGLLLYVAKLGSPAMGFVLFFALAIGLGTPLFVLATFSARMPVPGMWMVAVKKVAGFLLIGAAAYFVMPLAPEAWQRYMIPAIVIVGGIYLGFFEKSIKTTPATASVGKAFGVLALVAAVALASPTAKKSVMTWQPYSPKAVQQAVKQHKPVMIDFTADWCAYCKKLEHGPFADQKVVKATSSFVRLRVDATKQDRAETTAMRKYNVKGLPTIVFINSSGKEVTSSRVTGYIDSKEMLRRIQSAQ